MMYQLRIVLGTVRASRYAQSWSLHLLHSERRSAYKQLLQQLTSCIVTSGPLSILIKIVVSYCLREKHRHRRALFKYHNELFAICATLNQDVLEALSELLTRHEVADSSGRQQIVTLRDSAER